MLNTLDQKIRRAFSDAAIQYEVLSGLHKEIGRELIKKNMHLEKNQDILDVGMGTGWLTGKLAFYFPESNIVGLDFAEGMIDMAKRQGEGFHIVQASATGLPFKDNSFDIVVSNLSYQWVKDLEAAFKLCHQKLRKEGIFSFTMFGQKTFEELFHSLTQTVEKGEKQLTVPWRRLAECGEVEKTLSAAGFDDIKVDYERIKVNFPDMLSLVKWIKGIGANTLGQNLYFGKQWIERAGQYYLQNYKDRFGIYATFEVIWAQGKK